MADTIINVTLKGSAVSDGTIELRRLVQFGERLQKAVDRVAYSIEKQSGSRRRLREVRTDTTLRLLNTKKGSFAAELNFVRPPVLFEDYYDVATDAIAKLVSGLEFLRHSSNGELPDGYDQGVLIVLQDLGKTLNQGIESMNFTVTTPKESIDSTFDGHTNSRIIENISEPEEKIAAVTGHLLMANFGREKYRCHLYLANDKYISCTFDEDVIDDVDSAMRHQVNAIGIATLNPVDDEIDKFHIKQIIILDNEFVPPQQLTESLNVYIKENDTVASFHKSWEEVLSGHALPVSELWDGIDAE